MLQVIPFPHQYLGTSYLVISGCKALLFDAGLPFSRIARYLESHGLSLEAIYITHGHYDHIAGLSELNLDVPVYMGAEDLDYLTDPHLNLGYDMFGDPLELSVEAKPIGEGDDFAFDGHKVQVIATPFHTGGSLCFYFPDDGLLFSGDTLFRLSVGRSDLPGACPRFMETSLAKLTKLPAETIVYPGHGGKSTLAFELANNPYLHP